MNIKMTKNERSILLSILEILVYMIEHEEMKKNLKNLLTKVRGFEKE